jgi:hypothetical protein
MGKVLVERSEAHQEKLFQIDDVQLQVKLVDHKLNLLEDKLDGLDFTNLYYPQIRVPVA